MILVSIGIAPGIVKLASLTHVYRAIESRHTDYRREQADHHRRPSVRPTAAVAKFGENSLCTVPGR